MRKLSEQILLFLLFTSFVRCNSTKGKIADGKLLESEASKKIDSTNEERRKRLELQLRHADTILLVSHEQTYGPIFNKKNKSSTEAKRIVEDGIINKKAIHKTRLIEGQEKEKLISILTAEVKGPPIALASCFDPHHALILISKKSISYIEFCFSCGGVSTDKLEISSGDFDMEKWDRVFNYIDNKIPNKE